MLWFLPLEPLPERYTEQMHRWVIDELERRNVPYDTIYGEGSGSIEHGQFLGTYSSASYKAQQVAKMADVFASGNVRDGDVILLGDCWFPGVESLRMMAELSGKRVKIVGWHYAGMFDPADYYTRSLGRWAREWERILLRDVLDIVCVGSNYHRDLLVNAVPEAEYKIHACGLAWNSMDPQLAPGHDLKSRDPIIVFPHRLTQEKRPHVFARVAKRLAPKIPGSRWVVSSPKQVKLPSCFDGTPVELVVHEGPDSKASYYALLCKARTVYSSATQETFGYAIHEGIAFGCNVVAPRACCYPETLHDSAAHLYDPVHSDGDQQIMGNIPTPRFYTERYDTSISDFLDIIEGWS